MFMKILSGMAKAALSLFALLLCYVIWVEWFTIYWHTDELVLYQDEDSFRLCSGVKELIPFWEQNEQFDIHIPEAEKAIANGIPVTMFVRGKINHDSSEVYVARIERIVKGINNDCL